MGQFVVKKSHNKQLNKINNSVFVFYCKKEQNIYKQNDSYQNILTFNLTKEWVKAYHIIL